MRLKKQIDISTDCATSYGSNSEKARSAEQDLRTKVLTATPLWRADMTMEIVKIGSVDLGCEGRDEYVLVRDREDEVTQKRARDHVLPLVYRNTPEPGEYYCNTVRTMPGETDDEVICIIQHRFDN
jgi:hypothetical protein